MDQNYYRFQKKALHLPPDVTRKSRFAPKWGDVNTLFPFLDTYGLQKTSTEF